MVKQKNHTARNNTVKAHRNGIKKPKNHRFYSSRGVRALSPASRGVQGSQGAL
jgi:large subunit ribosomal protein L29e